MSSLYNKNRTLLIILDGWGLNTNNKSNAIHLARTPNFDNYIKNYPSASLESSGESVGLPVGQMGTSEVNHMIMGAGRVVFQELVRINKSIDNKTYKDNPAFLDAFEHVKKNNSTLHIKGMLSPGGVHTHQDHLFKLLEAAKEHDVKKVYLHIFTDGRDTMPQSALEYVDDLEQKIKDIGVGKIASISGRYYAMDRDHNWDRTEETFDVMINKFKGRRFRTAREAVVTSYESGITDEFIKPAKIEIDDQGEVGCIGTDDAVIFTNFRNDRPRQLTERFIKGGPANLKYVTMSTYHPDYQVRVAFPSKQIKNTLGEVISNKGLRQLRVTESEKYAHLTYFMNCKREESFDGEDRILLDSYSKIKSHDEKPEMRAEDIAEEIIQAMETKTHSLIITNFCNADMVGHTGNLKAAKQGIQTIDNVLGHLVQVAKIYDYHVIITADHGNAEEISDSKTGEPLSSHTTSLVPFILLSEHYKTLNRDYGTLADIAPTILQLLDVDIPKEMKGISFIDKSKYIEVKKEKPFYKKILDLF